MCSPTKDPFSRRESWGVGQQRSRAGTHTLLCISIHDRSLLWPWWITSSKVSTGVTHASVPSKIWHHSAFVFFLEYLQISSSFLANPLYSSDWEVHQTLAQVLREKQNFLNQHALGIVNIISANEFFELIILAPNGIFYKNSQVSQEKKFKLNLKFGAKAGEGSSVTGLKTDSF